MNDRPPPAGDSPGQPPAAGRLTITFDIFDTVLTRALAHPRDVFVHIGTELKVRGLSSVDPFAFGRARWKAEHAARAKSPWTEVLLSDIYRELGVALAWDDATVAAGQNVEMEIENRFIRGIPAGRIAVAAARAEAGQVAYLSDMYLPSPLMRDWLVREGVFSPGDHLLVSGEERGNKSSGALFATAREKLGAEYENWRHVGDNESADVASPRKLGIQPRHFTDTHLTGREWKARGTDGEFAETWRSLLSGAMRLARLDRPQAEDRDSLLWATGATVAGPLFYGFVRWVLADAQRRGIRRLYFLARDGQIFWRIAQTIQHAHPSPVECRYLYASRLVIAGSAELSSPEALRWLAAPDGHFHSLRQALWQLGLDSSPHPMSLPPELARHDPDSNLTPDERRRLADWLLQPERRQWIEEAMTRRANRARAYLEANGLRAGEPIGIVDTGWLGSIQRNLERILGEPDRPCPLTGYYLGLMPPAPPRPAGEALGYTNRFSPLPIMREESHKVLIELMAQSDHGQVVGLEPKDGSWVPWLNPPGPVDLPAIKLFQEAVLAFTTRLLETDSVASGTEDEFARAVIAIYRDFHDHPSVAEARLFGFMPHADQLFEQRHANLCGDLSFGGILAALADHRRRPPHWWIPGQAALGHAAVLRGFRALKALRWKIGGKPA
jgi:FMN phosphatase YigB (HAD superfamily)